MENINLKDMSNSELKLHMENLINEFNYKKNKIIKLCEEMEKIEKQYLNTQSELNIRKNLFN